MIFDIYILLYFSWFFKSPQFLSRLYSLCANTGIYYIIYEPTYFSFFQSMQNSTAVWNKQLVGSCSRPGNILRRYYALLTQRGPFS